MSLNGLTLSCFSLSAPTPSQFHYFYRSPLESSWLTLNPPSYLSLELFTLLQFFDALRNLLESQSYPCAGQDPPSITSKDPHTANLAADMRFYRTNVILPLLEEGKDLVLVLHSYGGASGGGAVQGLSKREHQAAGQKGGVIGLIYITAMCLLVGMSVQESLGLSDEMVPRTDVDEAAGILTVNAPIFQFYSHASTPEAEKWAAQILPQAIKSFKQKASYAASSDPIYGGKCAYMFCEDDHSFVLPLQQLWVQSSGITLTETLPTSHSPFLDMPKETADITVKFVGSFERME
ncbi:MAG: hypothetical protein MMC33_005403 [Icmadophila ericetorum]|nr:hypothetical protein [Icmadophila ericetorum]